MEKEENNFLEEGTKVKGDAKFNASLWFCQYLVGQITRAGDFAGQGQYVDWFEVCAILYRDTVGYMDSTEEEAAKKMYDELKELKDRYIQQMTNYQEARTKYRSVVVNECGFYDKLHDFDMFLKKCMKKHQLLVPVIKKDAGSAMGEE